MKLWFIPYTAGLICHCQSAKSTKTRKPFQKKEVNLRAYQIWKAPKSAFLEPLKQLFCMHVCECGKIENGCNPITLCIVLHASCRRPVSSERIQSFTRRAYLFNLNEMSFRHEVLQRMRLCMLLKAQSALSTWRVDRYPELETLYQQLLIFPNHLKKE